MVKYDIPIFLSSLLASAGWVLVAFIFFSALFGGEMMIRVFINRAGEAAIEALVIPLAISLSIVAPVLSYKRLLSEVSS